MFNDIPTLPVFVARSVFDLLVALVDVLPKIIDTGLIVRDCGIGGVAVGVGIGVRVAVALMVAVAVGVAVIVGVEVVVEVGEIGDG